MCDRDHSPEDLERLEGLGLRQDRLSGGGSEALQTEPVKYKLSLAWEGQGGNPSLLGLCTD
jgi:hypothetical protein